MARPRPSSSNVVTIGAWIVALAFVGLLAVWPLLSGGAVEGFVGPSGPAVDPPATVDASLIARTVLWHAIIALIAVVVAWPIGAALERRFERSGRIGIIGVLALATVLMAPWILFSAWWTILSPGNPLHDWLASHGHGTALRRATLLLGLVGWAWAPAALVMWWWRATHVGAERTLDALDGVCGAARLRAAWRRDWRGLLLAGIVVILVLAADTVCFDLAQEPSVGFELRSLEAQGASNVEIARAGLAASMVTLVMAMLVLIPVLHRRRRLPGSIRPNGDRAGFPSSETRATIVWLFVLPIGLVVVPLLLLGWRALTGHGAVEFITLHGRGAVNALLILGGVAAGGALLAAAHAQIAVLRTRRAIGGDSRPSVFGRAPVAAIAVFLVLLLWLWVAVMPAAAYAAIVADAWNGAAWLRPLLDSPLGPVIMIAAGIGRFGLMAVVIGAVAGNRWRATHDELDRLDGAARSARVTLLRRRPVLARAALGAAITLAALAAGEIAIAARLEPPGFDWIASSILSAIHYQRPGSVTIAILAVALLAFVAALLLAAGLRRRSMARARDVPRASILSVPIIPLMALASAAGMLPISGCERNDGDTPPPLPDARQVGGPGVIDGTFEQPRVIALDPGSGDFVIIDKTARVQRFDRAGTFLSAFRMPEWSNGKPVGATFAADGTLLIADTHYHRVLAYDRNGRELRRFGRFGYERGEFVYPTDIAIAKDGRLFIGEFGGNDRVQVFAPDGAVLRIIGGPGKEEGAFERPQSLALSHDDSELFVADCCNHRIQVFDASTGALRRVLGGLGRAPGEFAYPWAVLVLRDGTLLVAEWGNDRLQRVDARDGRALEMMGGRGRGLGRLWQPWALAEDGERVLVVDYGNNRLQSFPLESLSGAALGRAEPR